jgi:hypothetical protein
MMVIFMISGTFLSEEVLSFGISTWDSMIKLVIY